MRPVVLYLMAAIDLTSSVTVERPRYPSDDFSYAGEWAGLFSGMSPKGQTYGLNLKLDPTFSPHAKSIIREAMAIFMERALAHRVVDCAFDNATKDVTRSREAFEREMINVLAHRRLDNLEYPGYGYVARYWDDRKSVGAGYVGLFYKTDRPLPGYGDRHYFYVALNSDFIGPDSPYAYADDEEYWAGVLAHEFLHNLGYSHPTGYPGSFIEEYGNCLASDGVAGAAPAGAVPDHQVYDHR